MNELSYVYHKTVEPSVKKYALCSNPRDGAVSRTYFPPSTYELSRQNEFIHKEISRRAAYQKRTLRTNLDNNLNLDKRNAPPKLPPIRLNERIIDDYEPGKLFKDGANGRQVTSPTSQQPTAENKIVPFITKTQLITPGPKQQNKSEMRLRFEAEEEYLDRVRMNKRLSNIMSHRVERFYYLQGGNAHLSARSPTRLNKLGTSKSFDGPQLALTYNIGRDSRKSPIDRVYNQNENERGPKNSPDTGVKKAGKNSETYPKNQKANAEINTDRSEDSPRKSPEVSLIAQEKIDELEENKPENKESQPDEQKTVDERSDEISTNETKDVKDNKIDEEATNQNEEISSANHNPEMETGEKHGENSETENGLNLKETSEETGNHMNENINESGEKSLSNSNNVEKKTAENKIEEEEKPEETEDNSNNDEAAFITQSEEKTEQ